MDVVNIDTSPEIIDTRVARVNMMDTPHLDPESDNEDDPTKLLNQWLGELNTLKKVKLTETEIIESWPVVLSGEADRKNIWHLIFTLLGIG